MGFNANDKPKMPEQELPEDGLWGARLARVIELGDQEDKYGVKTKVVLAFTIPGQTIEIDGEKKQRMMMTFPLNQTSNPDATLMKYMKALGGATWEDVIGKPCMIEITHKDTQKGMRANISNITKPMNGMDVPEPDCDVYIFDFEKPDKSVFDKLSEFRQQQIKEAKDYQGSAVQAMLDGKVTSQAEDTSDDSEDSPI